MIKFEDNVDVWITSDSHFGHKNICRGVTSWRLPDGSIPENKTRPFKTIEQMNEAIIKGFNDNVGQDDILIHHGDWSFGGYENIKLFWDRLICKNIYLFLGNHDHHIENNRGGCQGLFKKVVDYLEYSYRGHKFAGFHYPISSHNGLRKGVIHTHGHVHFPVGKTLGKGKKIDCGLDGHPEFRPYNLYREIIIPMDKIPVGSELGGDDHHTDDIVGIVG
jgi:calcineurin-like phosphoesterase family protein